MYNWSETGLNIYRTTYEKHIVEAKDRAGYLKNLLRKTYSEIKTGEKILRTSYTNVQLNLDRKNLVLKC